MTTSSESTAAADRLDRYEHRTSRALIVLAFVFIAVYALPILEPDLDPTARSMIEMVSWAIWFLFAIDLAVRVTLTDRPWRYLATHPIDVASVLLPALRPLRVLRVFTAAQTMISRAGRFSFLRATQAITMMAGLLVFIAALAVLDAERAAGDDANITGFPDALWWAATTVTTVGYGDRFPVTGTGRIVAAALMILGIALVGAVTAAVAGWFVSQTQGAAEAGERAVEERLSRLERQLAEIHAAVIGVDHGRRLGEDRTSPAEP